VLYLDSSALAKRYFRERGGKQLRARLELGDRVFTSEVTYAEIHAVFARKYLRERSISRKTFDRLRRTFLNDWMFSLNKIEVASATSMTAIPHLLETVYIRGADAIHLAAAIWLRDVTLVGAPVAGGETNVEFGVADARLAAVAGQFGLSVFNPEAAG
jgi:predicted nucleic acid-binding protein